MANRNDRQDRRATALMTAESILVGFLFAYAPIFNQTLVYWSQKGAPLFGTVVAALLVYALALTAFRSILLLYRSIGTDNPNDRNYRAGYGLFLMVIFGSSVYVLMNAASIVQFAWTGRNVSVPDEHLSIIITLCFFAGWVLLVVFKPLELTECVRCIRNRFGARLFWTVVFLVFWDVVFAGMIVQGPLLLQWPWAFVPTAFAVVTIVAILIAHDRRLTEG